MTGRLAKVYCTSATAAGRVCRAVGRWFIAGGADYLCKRHARERALLHGDPRIVNTLTGRIEMVDPSDVHITSASRPVPQGIDAIVADLAVARTDRDIDRCRLAILTQIEQVKDERLGLKSPVLDAWRTAKARVARLQGRTA